MVQDPKLKLAGLVNLYLNIEYTGWFWTILVYNELGGFGRSEQYS